MSDVLIVSFPGSADIARSDLAAVGFGRAVADRAAAACDLLVLGPHAPAVSEALAASGVRRVLTGEHADLVQATAEARTRAIVDVALSGGYRLIAAASGTTARDCLPRVAARLGAGMVSDVVAVGDVTADKLAVTKPCYSGNLLANVELSGPISVATCRASAFDPAESADQPAAIAAASLGDSLAHERKQFVQLDKTPMDRPELTEADVVVTGGRGTKGDFSCLEQLADLLGAGLGASRAAVDAGWMPNDFQVGQTGKIIAPKVYIGCGISGAIQHLAGMRNSKTIVCINKDPNAPLFEVADYGIVADLFEAVPQMIEVIKSRRAQPA